MIHVQSSLTEAGRKHACPGEPLVFTCAVNGQYIQWTFNSCYRTMFFPEHNVNRVQTVSGQYGVRAILTGINSTGDSMVKHFTSSLIIESSDSLLGNLHVHNISCSSNTKMHIQQLKIACKMFLRTVSEV